MRDAGFEPVAAFNPFWDRNGVTFEDPDGYRIVLQNVAWIYWKFTRHCGTARHHNSHAPLTGQALLVRVASSTE
jgi:hypothetical protein